MIFKKKEETKTSLSKNSVYLGVSKLKCVSLVKF